MTKLIITALYAEAKPLIGLFGLKKDRSSTKLPVYRDELTALTVSGPGKLKSAIATTYLLAQEKNPKDCVAFNIGLCGGVDPAGRLGDLFFVNKITDRSSGRSYYPDILLRHGLPEAALTTFDEPVVRINFDNVPGDLVDMEASGFFESAATFLSPHRIACLKLVSDFLRAERLEPSQASELVTRNLEAIERIVSSYDALASTGNDRLERDYALLMKLRDQLRLTESQYHQLINLAKGYKLRNDSLEVLQRFIGRSVATKQERNHRLEHLRAALMGE